MFSIPVRIAASIKVNLYAERAVSIALANKTFENVERFIGLQMAAGKAVLAESTVAANEFFSVKGTQELFPLGTEERQLNIEKPSLIAAESPILFLAYIGISIQQQKPSLLRPVAK